MVAPLAALTATLKSLLWVCEVGVNAGAGSGPPPPSPPSGGGGAVTVYVANTIGESAMFGAAAYARMVSDCDTWIGPE
jgi:hypothetical protein